MQRYVTQWRSQPKIFWAAKMFDFRRETVFSLGYRLSKRKRCSDTVTADNNKTRCFIICKSKQVRICGNASASTSLKIPLQFEIVSVTIVPE